MVATFSVPGTSAGKYSSAVDKLGIHTTEGASIESAVAAYQANNSWPHDTVDFRFGKPYRWCRHLDYREAARSFRNNPGGVQTNTDGVIQVEVVGFSSNPGLVDWEAFGREYVGPVCRTNGIPVQSSVRWVAYPASYGEQAGQRLTGTQWDVYKGILGHQHVPENSHGDPGAIPIDVILRAAAEGDDDLPTPAEVWAHPIDSKIDGNPRPAQEVLAWAQAQAQAASEQAGKLAERVDVLEKLLLGVPQAVWDHLIFEQISGQDRLASQLLNGAHYWSYVAVNGTPPAPEPTDDPSA